MVDLSNLRVGAEVYLKAKVVELDPGDAADVKIDGIGWINSSIVCRIVSQPLEPGDRVRRYLPDETYACGRYLGRIEGTNTHLFQPHVGAIEVVEPESLRLENPEDPQA